MNCKHRWVEGYFNKLPRKPNHYMFWCTRCSQARFAQLLTQEKSPGLVSRG